MKTRSTFCTLMLLFALSITHSPLHAQFVGTCRIFPATDPWNQDISQLPVHPNSANFIAKINMNKGNKTKLHPDFGSPVIYGIPYEVVGASQPMVPITYDAYGSESDPGPMPIPPNALVEGGAGSGGDMHVLVVDTSNHTLYELYSSRKNSSDNGWTAASGAIFDLTQTKYRPDGWTSADAAGLPIFPGLVRYDEVQSGVINHAVRFTTDSTQRGWITPARHNAGRSKDTNAPPMGLRLRLKADYDISNFTGGPKVLLTALKKYGMILADNGSSWFISGATDTRWNDNEWSPLKTVPSSAFEVVYTGPIKHVPDQSLVAFTEPESSDLEPNYPNPFSQSTSIGFTLAAPAHVQLDVYDMMGRNVASVASGLFNEGEHTARFDATHLASGIYFVRLQADAEIHREQVQVMR